MNIISSIKGTS